jgi:hypothetical protein
MCYKIFLAVLLFCVAAISGCKKKDTKVADPVCCAIPYVERQSIPYDTTGLSGVFSAHIITDSTTAGGSSRVTFAASLPLYTETIRLNANARELLRKGTSLQVTETYVLDTLTANYPVAWVMTGNGVFNFSYTNNDTFPSLLFVFPDTVTAGVSNTFYFSASNNANGDTIMLEIPIPSTKDSAGSYLRYYTKPTGSIAIPESVVESLTGKNIRVSVSVFSHRYIMINSYKRLFIKQRTLSANAFFK